MKKLDNIIIRQAQFEDAKKLCDFIKLLDCQSDFLLFGKDERRIDINVAQKYLEKILSNSFSAAFLAIDAEYNIIGFACGENSNVKRISHISKCNIGILIPYRKTALSRMLTKNLIYYLREKGIKRIEASVIKENKLSLNLYKKFGFVVEGVKQKSVKIDDKFYDEYMLALIFNN